MIKLGTYFIDICPLLLCCCVVARYGDQWYCAVEAEEIVPSSPTEYYDRCTRAQGFMWVCVDASAWFGYGLILLCWLIFIVFFSLINFLLYWLV